jgi:hypothetical protein
MSGVILSAALDYAAHGCAVLPASRNKCPLVEHGARDASVDPAVISGWWEKFRNANVAIAAGPISGIWALDVDGDDGRTSLQALIKQHGQLPHAPANITAKGCHLVFAMPADGRLPRNVVGRIGRGLDVRCDGACFTAPPSVHQSGHVYRWAKGRSIFDLAAPQAPEWLIGAACRLPEPKRPAAPARAPIDDTWGPSPAYSRAALDRAGRTVAAALPGQQEATLNAEAYSIGQLVAGGVMPARFARQVLVWAGLKMTNGDARRPWQAHEIEIKVDRAFADALSSPRAVPERAA